MIAVPKIPVAIGRCQSYQRQDIIRTAAELFAALPFPVSKGSTVLLKPNLVAAGYHADLACTHPEFVAGVAQYFVDLGAHVVVGDSPATGSGLRAMTVCGMTEALKGLPVSLASFQETRKIMTRSGLEIPVAVDALECDYFINMPKLKSHSQTRVSLAVKNHYGIIKGWNKAWGHQVHGGGDGHSFFELLSDLPFVVPQGVSLCDAICAMHVSGPMDGEPYPLGVMAASPSALALDRSLMAVINLDPQLSPLWCVCRDRKDAGYDLTTLDFPLLTPGQVQVADFIVPPQLNSVRFGVRHVLGSLVGRFKVWLARQK
ncbi:MAG: DUF362 domain-containing protein [Proteobacteria bacterium]|nr:DUF362 domain-containing protein [Pseudomonadota bacterium]